MRVNPILRGMAAGVALLASGAAAHAESFCTNVIPKYGMACYASKDECVRAVNAYTYLPLAQAERACYGSMQRNAYGNACTDYLKFRNSKDSVCYPTMNDCIKAVAAVYKKNYSDAAKLCHVNSKK